MTIEINGFLRAFLAKAARNPDQAFAVLNAKTLTFGDIERKSAAVAARVRGLGLRQGDTVAVMMRNSELSIPIIYGLARAGVVWVPVNAQQRGDGLRYILEHSASRLIICDPDLLPTIQQSGALLAPDSIVLTSGAGSIEEIVNNEFAFEDPLPAASDVFAIMYTSGTTGRPKGVLVTHQMMRLAGESVRRLTKVQPGDVFFVWEPLYHIGGAQLIVLPLLEEASLALVDRFSASRFWAQVRESGATHVHYLGGILQILLKQPEHPADRDHKVRVAWGAGCTKEVWPLFRDRFGVDIRECYGMTEASSVTTYNDNGPIGSVGTPMPWLTVDILDEHDLPVAQGERGEIVIRTATEGAFFEGYLKNSEATEKALRNGALHTGDAGSLDQAGNLWFHGRLTDSVRCKGENVSAWEVEHIAGAYPTIEDCAMIGVSSELGEQDIKLFVKPKVGTQVSPPELSRWLTDRLASYQNPRYIAVVDEFERTPSQRIMKHMLSRNFTDCWDRLAP